MRAIGAGQNQKAMPGIEHHVQAFPNIRGQAKHGFHKAAHSTGSAIQGEGEDGAYLTVSRPDNHCSYNWCGGGDAENKKAVAGLDSEHGKVHYARMGHDVELVEAANSGDTGNRLCVFDAHGGDNLLGGNGGAFGFPGWQ